MKKLQLILFALIVALFLSSCSGSPAVTSGPDLTSDEPTSEETAAPTTTKRQLPTPTPEAVRDYADALTEKERGSITIGPLSPEHEYYEGAVESDPQIKNYLTEISIYDEEIDDTFIVHVVLPPNFSSEKSYPAVIMTDGIWRLQDFPVLRGMMSNGEIEELILVSIGYPNGYDYERIRERDFVDDPESFLHFIVDNLIPYLSENNPIDPESLTLTGHSLGGYFAFYTLFHSDTIGSVNYRARITNLCATVTGRGYDELYLAYDAIEGESHNSVFLPSVTDALRVFYGIG